MIIVRDEFIIKYKNEDFCYDLEECMAVMKANNCKYMLLFWVKQNELNIICISESRRIRAIELLDYLVSEFGLIKGDAKVATGLVSFGIIKTNMLDRDIDSIEEYFATLVEDYYSGCVWVEAKDYAHTIDLTTWPLYKKKRIKWAYVKSTDIVPEGEGFIIKSLENESGERIIANENSYIMIGCRGEIYEISKEKFDKTYEASDKILDVFEQMLEYIPEVTRVSNGEYISIDDKANICYPKADMRIYVLRLEQRTKVFPAKDTDEYFLGREGDYIVIREDDIQDVYIIQGDIFENTYELS